MNAMLLEKEGLHEHAADGADRTRAAADSGWRTNAEREVSQILLMQLREEILAVVSRHVSLDPGQGDRQDGERRSMSRRYEIE